MNENVGRRANNREATQNENNARLPQSNEMEMGIKRSNNSKCKHKTINYIAWLLKYKM